MPNMNTILVAYDLIGTDESSADYQRLIKRIKEYPNWAKVLYSTFIVKTSWSPSQVRDDLDKYLDRNDRIFVAALTGVAAWRNVICDSDWLKKNL
jgi:hypothetical protein